MLFHAAASMPADSLSICCAYVCQYHASYGFNLQFLLVRRPNPLYAAAFSAVCMRLTRRDRSGQFGLLRASSLGLSPLQQRHYAPGVLQILRFM
jgi:hypothetical protein